MLHHPLLSMCHLCSMCLISSVQALFAKLGLNGKPAHTAPLEPPLQMSKRVVVTHRSVSGSDGAVVDIEETQQLPQVA